MLKIAECKILLQLKSVSTRPPHILLLLLFIIFCLLQKEGAAQSVCCDTLTFSMQPEDVRVVIVKPGYIRSQEGVPVPVVYYALPNGNSIEQTMGKTPKDSASWRDGIQHIEAQSKWLREIPGYENLIVVYLEAKGRSWPGWKRDHLNDYLRYIRSIDSTIKQSLALPAYTIMLNGHSGGGRFIFSYIDAFERLPPDVSRISFIDSNYGYEAKYEASLKNFCENGGVLTVFAYNDSIALYNGKPFVSDTGGTWYRSYMMLRDFENSVQFVKEEDDSLITYTAARKNTIFIFKKNPDRGIYHTEQVAYNGFIHSILAGTTYHENGYTYFGSPVYTRLISP